MTLAKAKVRANKTYIAQASLMIITYDRQNIFIVQATCALFKALSSMAKLIVENTVPSMPRHSV